MVRSAHVELDLPPLGQVPVKPGSEPNVSVGHYLRGEAVVPYNILHQQVSCSFCGELGGRSCEADHFGQSIDEHNDSIMTSLSFWQLCNEVYRQLSPWFLRNAQWL